jgi:hypothetical protein
MRSFFEDAPRQNATPAHHCCLGSAASRHAITVARTHLSCLRAYSRPTKAASVSETIRQIVVGWRRFDESLSAGASTERLHRHAVVVELTGRVHQRVSQGKHRIVERAGRGDDRAVLEAQGDGAAVHGVRGDAGIDQAVVLDLLDAGDGRSNQTCVLGVALVPSISAPSRSASFGNRTLD